MYRILRDPFSYCEILTDVGWQVLLYSVFIYYIINIINITGLGWLNIDITRLAWWQVHAAQMQIRATEMQGQAAEMQVQLL